MGYQRNSAGLQGDANGKLGKQLAQIAIQPDQPVLIAGPTASGKSALALEIATQQGGTIINADALQVFGGWRILTARPPEEDLAQAPHVLYGHVRFDQPYSVGDWLRDVTPLLKGNRPIIVGGTGLYFSALTEGLAEIPATEASVRARADTLTLGQLIETLDTPSKSNIDLHNRARVQRAWEVLTQTGRGIADWQAETPPPLLPKHQTIPILLDAPKDWLTPRIEQRFDIMLKTGALEEAERMRPTWDPGHPSSKAIGARELIAHLEGDMPLEDARDAAVIATRQYAKRQRTWFAKRMRDWHKIHMPTVDLANCFRFER